MTNLFTKSKKLLCLSIILLLVFTLALTGCGDSDSTKESNNNDNISDQNTYGYYGKLHVDGTVLKAHDGATVQLKGLSSHGLSWFPQYVNKENLIQMQQEWGCNVFRLAMYTDETDGYAVSSEDKRDELEELIEQAVDDAEELGMYIIIDWHVLKDNNPNQHIDLAMEFFDEMSDEFSDNDNVLYEICNEPNGDTTWADIKSYAEKVIPVIQNNNKDAIVIVGTPTWSQDVDKAALDPITKYDNIMYAFHYYAATHKDDFRNRVKAALDDELPIFVSEFGICDASGNGAIDENEANTWLSFMNENNISYCMWNFSNKDESSAIIKSTVEKISGFSESDLSNAGLWFVNNIKNSTSKENSNDNSQNKTTELAVTVTPEDAWNDGSNDYTKYNVKVDNGTNSKVNGWIITITFDKSFKVTESWNGKFKTSGKTLTINSESYNSAINPGDDMTNVGFIIKADKDIKVKSAVVK